VFNFTEFQTAGEFATLLSSSPYDDIPSLRLFRRVTQISNRAREWHNYPTLYKRFGPLTSLRLAKKNPLTAPRYSMATLSGHVLINKRRTSTVAKKKYATTEAPSGVRRRWTLLAVVPRT